MKLTCALVLLVQISCVISNPYGYGPRAGASAKAETNAAASSINFPQGAGYSGSISKSYSASSASSSASSSSSSSSISFSASGVSPIKSDSGCGTSECNHGVKGLTANHGNYNGNNNGSPIGQGSSGHYNNDLKVQEDINTKCTSGNCQSAPNSGLHDTTGSSNLYSGANSLASTAAGSQSGSAYKNNIPNTPGCQGSDCNVPSPTVTKCSSGLCGTPDADSVEKNKCLSGNCDTAPIEAPSTNNAKCLSGQCGSGPDSDDIQINNSASAISKTNYGSYGQTPPTNFGCTFGNCGIQSGSKPSSYIPEYPPCSSPDCNNYGQGPTGPSGTHSYNKPSVLLTAPKDDSECSSPNCQPGQPQLPSIQNYSPSNDAVSQTAFTNPSTSCMGDNCYFGSTKAPYSTGPTNSINSYEPSQKPNPSNYPTSQPQRPTGGYSGKPSYGSSPSHSLLPESKCVPGSPNCNAGVPTSSNNNVIYAPGLVPIVNNNPPLPSTPANSCIGPPDLPCNDAFIAPVSNKGPWPPSNNQPNNPSHSSLPANLCTGPPGTPCNDAFYVPVCAPGSPNCNSKPSPNKVSSLPSYGQHNSNDVFIAPVCAPGSPSCSPNNKAHGNVHVGTVTGPVIFPNLDNSIAKPTYSASSAACTSPNCGKPLDGSDNKIPYQGGFGGPSGILKPNEFKSPEAPLTSTSNTNTGNLGCGSENCAKPSSPSYGVSPGSAAAPGSESTGFGGPAGILKPNEFAAPNSGYSKPISGPSVTKPGCSTGNCREGTPSYSQGSSGTQAAATASASANAVAYTGGFGGPPGLLKPYDDGKLPVAPEKSQSGQYVSQHGKNYNNALGSHQGSYTNNGAVSNQGAYSNNGAVSNQDAYSNNGQGTNQGAYFNNNAASYQVPYSNNGLGSHQGSYSNNGITSQPISGQTGSLAQSFALAGSLSGSNGDSSYNTGSYGRKSSSGCSGGCGGSGSYGGLRSSGYGGNGASNVKSDDLGSIKDGWSTLLGANAKSLAGSVSSGGYGAGGYASSSASAHATAGAAIKGSYGK